MRRDDDHHPDDATPSLPIIDPEALDPWQRAAYTSWLSLGRRIFQKDSDPPLSIRQFARECEMLIAVAAWFQHHGNITHAADYLGSGRRATRARLKRWHQRYPHLVPPEVEGRALFQVAPRNEQRRRRSTHPAGSTPPCEAEASSEHREDSP